MIPKQSTIDEIITSESELFYVAEKKYGDYFVNCFKFNGLLQNFTVSVDASRHVFAAFLSQVRKHLTLALFSAVRLHHTQAMMNLRQVLEAGAFAAYAIANPDKENFVEKREDGYLDAPQGLIVQRYKWLEENYPEGQKPMKQFKDIINQTTAHSNLIYAYNNFYFNEETGKFETPFFDIGNERLVKTDLWQIGNVAMGLMDLFYGVDKKIGSIKFVDNFIPHLKNLEVENKRLGKEMKTILDERIKKHTINKPK